MHTYSLSCICVPVCLVKTRQQKPEKEKEQGEEQSWKDRPLHGMHHRQIEEVADIQESGHWWTERLEALIMAAHEQVLSTRSVEAGSTPDKTCKDDPETIQQQAGQTSSAITKWPAQYTRTSVPSTARESRGLNGTHLSHLC